MSLKSWLERPYWVLRTQLGMDPRAMWRSLTGVPRYLRDLAAFKERYRGRLELVPCLNDRCAEGGTTRNEYFWQDLLVARMIFQNNPKKHVDIGSRVDGFVSHVASFREIEVFDVRPIAAQIPGITFRQADLMQPLDGMAGYCDSLSCLHALEHFGLGRYGDPVDPEGYVQGLASMSVLLEAGGTFLLSVPIGVSRVEFNANRVFDPADIIRVAEQNLLRLSSLTVIRQGTKLEVIAADRIAAARLSEERYALGIFTFIKS
jgi:hypothetical protein